MGISKNPYSIKASDGVITHYDEDGCKLGVSIPGDRGSYNHYDAEGIFIGYTTRGFLGTVNHYDQNGNWKGTAVDFDGLYDPTPLKA